MREANCHRRLTVDVLPPVLITPAHNCTSPLSSSFFHSTAILAQQICLVIQEHLHDASQQLLKHADNGTVDRDEFVGRLVQAFGMFVRSVKKSSSHAHAESGLGEDLKNFVVCIHACCSLRSLHNGQPTNTPPLCAIRKLMNSF